MAMEEGWKKPLLPASPKFLWLHGLPNPAFEIRCTMALSDLLIFCSSLFPLSLTLSPEDPFVAGGRRVGERTSSLLTLGIFPQRHSLFLHLHAFLLSPNPTQCTLPTLAHGSGFRNTKPVTDRLAFPFKLLLRQWTQNGIWLVQKGEKREKKGKLEGFFY